MIGHSLRGDLIACDGTVSAALPASFFVIRLDNGQQVTCRPSGRMQLHRIAIVTGDRVAVEVTAGCFSHGRITYRYTGEAPVIKRRHRRAKREGRTRRDAENAVLA
jgi:translation initiation factor IF-1